MRTHRKDRFVNITTIIWIVVNFITYLITMDLAIVAVFNMGFLLFLFLILKDKKLMNWLNEKDWHKAISLTMSKPKRKFYIDDIGYKKSVQMKKDKSARRAENNGIRAQYSDEQLEAQLKAEDDFIMDVFDSYYDKEDMHT